MYKGIMWYFLHLKGATYTGGLFLICDDCYSKKLIFYATPDKQTVVEYIPSLAQLRFLYQNNNIILCVLHSLFATFDAEGVFTFRYKIKDDILYRSDGEEYPLTNDKYYTFFNVHSLDRMNAEELYRVPSSLTFSELVGVC